MHVHCTVSDFVISPSVMTNLDPSRGVTAPQIQCRLAPLIPAIQDSAALYDLVFKLMKALHSALPADTLAGHRERFNRQYQALRKYFHEASKLEYLKSLVKIPSLSPDPPSFLLPGQLIEEELSKLVQTLPPPADEEASLTSLTTTGSLVEPATGEPDEGRDSTDARFDDEFGAGGFQQFDFQRARRDDRDALIEQLMREIVDLKEKVSELEGQRQADQELLAGLRERLLQMEAELNDYKEIAEQTCNENVLLKRQIDASQTEQGAQSEAEARSKAAEEKFVKLREVYQKLRSEHIVLLRTNGETQKKIQTTENSAQEAEAERMRLEGKVNSLSLELEEVKLYMNDEAASVAVLREELRKKEAHSIQLEQVQKSLSEQLQAKEESAPHTLIGKSPPQAAVCQLYMPCDLSHLPCDHHVVD